MELIETPIFTKKITGILSDDEYGQTQWSLAINPDPQLFHEAAGYENYDGKPSAKVKVEG